MSCILSCGTSMGVKLHPFESSFASLRLTEEKPKPTIRSFGRPRPSSCRPSGRSKKKNVGFQSEIVEIYKFWLPISLMPQRSVLHFFCFSPRHWFSMLMCQSARRKWMKKMYCSCCTNETLGQPQQYNHVLAVEGYIFACPLQRSSAITISTKFTAPNAL